MYYFYSVLCNRISHTRCCCVWLIIQIMYFLQTGFFHSQNAAEVVPSWSCSTIYTLQHFLHAIYFRCYNNYMIEENDNYKVGFYFLSPNVLLLFVFKIAKLNDLFFLRKSVLCIWFSKKGIKHQFHLSWNYWK